MAVKNIRSLVEETELSDSHLIMSQADTDTDDIKKTPLSLLKSFLSVLFVSKVDGKTLSTNDYGDTDKAKVNLIDDTGYGTRFLSDNGIYVDNVVDNNAVYNTLGTIDKTIIGAINEINIRLNSLENP